MRKITGLMALLAILLLSACGGVNLTSTQNALHFGGGATESQKFKGCKNPSERDNFAPGDKFYTYQNDVRSFAAVFGDVAKESEPIEVLSSEKETVRIPVTVAFYLKTDCETLLDFHNTVGEKYGAYNEDGRPGDGWRELLTYAIGNPLNLTLDSLSETKSFNELIGSEETRRTLETEIAKSLPAEIAQRTGGKQFFDRFEVQVQKPTLANQAILDAISGQNAAVEQGKQAEAKAKADGAAAKATAEAERDAAAARAEAANAQVAVTRAEAAKRQAEIAGYGSADEYNKAKAIEKGINPYRDTYVVPQGG